MPPRRRAGTSGIEPLPDALLGSILALAGLSEGPTITLVCKRWRRLFLEEGSLWNRFRLVPGRTVADAGSWLPCKLALLRRVAPLVRKLTVADGPAGPGAWQLDGSRGGSSSASRQPSLAAVLAECFPPPASGLVQLVISCAAQALPASTAEAVGRMSRLQGLAIEGASLPPAPALGALLGGLPALRALLLSSASAPLPAGVVGTLVPHAARLTALELSTTSAALPPAGTLDQLTGLSCLCSLTLADGRQGASLDPLQLPAPAHFPSLEAFDYRVAGLFQVAGARMLECSWKQHQQGDGWLGRPPETAEDGGSSGLPPVCRQLTLGGVLELPSLAGLLAALRPRGGGGAPPDSLLLFACRLDHAALEGAGPQLSSLAELALGRCLWPDFEAGLGALLALCPRLESLTLMDCPQGGGLPACLCSRRGLRHLMLPGTGLSHLPPGHYLETLEYLAAGRGCCFPALPAAIAGARALQWLDLRGSTQLALTAEDVALLASLPRLLRLVVPTERTPSRVLRALRRAAPRLRVGLLAPAPASA
ncbi:hypothetical protein ABPG75_000907 [Micractinium tetrahymenae]